MNGQNDGLLRSSRSPSPNVPSTWGPETVRHNAGYSEAASLVSRESISPVNEHPAVNRAAPFTPRPLKQGPDVSCESKTALGLQPSRSTLASWAFEILALTTSVASIIAIIAVLIRENGRAVTAWKFAFTINTVIATLGSIARTTLAFAMSACVGQQKWSWLRRRSDSVRAFERFDEASRGPWGGTRLFIWLRFRHWAALGALVTVGTIAFDPFLQAVISTYGQLDESADFNATISKSWHVDGGAIIKAEGPSGMSALNTQYGMLITIPTTSRPDFGTVSSIYVGFDNNSVPYSDTIAFECATGNCTWPIFLSAAVCSSCEDVSDEFIIYNKHFDNDAYNMTSTPDDSEGGGINIGDGEAGNYSIFSLPYSEIRNWNGYTIAPNGTGYGYQISFGDRVALGYNRTLMTVNTTYNAWQTMRFSNLETLLMSFLVIRATDDWIASKIPWQSSHPTATECALYLCTNLYQAQSESGILKEDVVGSWADRDPESYKINTTDLTLSLYSEETEPSKWTKLDFDDLYDPGQSVDLSRYDLRLTVPPEQFETYPSTLGRDVNISHAMIRSTIDFLHSFTGRTRDDISSSLPHHNSSYLTPVQYPDGDVLPFLDPLWNSKNLTATFENVASSLTKQIRNTSPLRQQGAVQSWITHVRVDWVYLIYPISMLLIGILYVALVMIESMRLKIPVWKEKALPTLLHGFDDETQSLLRKRQGYGVDKKEDTRVRFAFDEREGCSRLVIE